VVGRERGRVFGWARKGVDAGAWTRACVCACVGACVCACACARACVCVCVCVCQCYHMYVQVLDHCKHVFCGVFCTSGVSESPSLRSLEGRDCRAEREQALWQHRIRPSRTKLPLL
jgi:hypothetical protein